MENLEELLKELKNINNAIKASTVDEDSIDSIVYCCDVNIDKSQKKSIDEKIADYNKNDINVTKDCEISMLTQENANLKKHLEESQKTISELLDDVSKLQLKLEQEYATSTSLIDILKRYHDGE